MRTYKVVTNGKSIRVIDVDTQEFIREVVYEKHMFLAGAYRRIKSFDSVENANDWISVNTWIPVE